MGSVFRRKKKLYLKVKNESGAWVQLATGLNADEKSKAKAMLAEVESLLSKGEPLADAVDAAKTVKAFARTWIESRRQRGLGCVDDDETRLELHVLPSIGEMRLNEVRPRHIRDLVRHLKVKPKERDKNDVLAPRTVRSIFFMVKGMFQEALVDELITSNPCILPKGELPKKKDKDPTWRSGAIFTRAEVEKILSDESTPLDRRVVYAMAFLGGPRFGEGAALRWKHYFPDEEPLGRLEIAQSFSTRIRKEKAVKTETPRTVPVHPALAKVLARWKLSGWAQLMGRPPTQEDLILPSRADAARNRSVTLGLERFHEDLERLGLRERRQHDARRTFVTLAIQGGANKEILRWVSHGRRQSDIMDQYTEPSWESRCEAVLCIKINLLEGKVLPLARAAGVASTWSMIESKEVGAHVPDGHGEDEPAGGRLGALLGALDSFKRAKNTEPP